MIRLAHTGCHPPKDYGALLNPASNQAARGILRGYFCPRRSVADDALRPMSVLLAKLPSSAQLSSSLTSPPLTITLGADSSPASFEKTLSSLSSKITTSQSQLDRLHTSARRVKVLWTLYFGFAYVVYAIVLLLVVGHKNLGAYEWTGMAGGPILVYVVRALINAYFNFRIESETTRLKGYHDDRAKTIQKLKDATRYDSTLQLIEKYGGEKKGEDEEKSEENGTKQGREHDKAKKKPHVSSTGRTNLPPPPTANIARPDAQPQPHDVDAEFAPNAYAPPAPSRTQYMVPETHWYDRIFDVLLGEDETAAKNRFALICHSCRLVNGQAPPGTKSLVERIVDEVLGAKGVQASGEDVARAGTQVGSHADLSANDDENFNEIDHDHEGGPHVKATAK
ncbi:uncharacterized protein MAM_07755 [Metarhizium album ARSEF 1941]|uniref:Endoplasmic reticulum junction formation protein lunapark n=1 Tax=Metarhizium album (strain ARSEF 1941) TaxID=1081103 RepID=A0A0B2WL66_METAS|nr:uncharacterized protein MAM_07755 [Metarhizium album ARSEF 1941]KHN94439.1 hypothetical protein MAM_07755 [Metarhizium album ARSEF 1941]